MTLAPEVEAARRGARPESPYVGLVPFGEDDERFFFGRSQETAIVSANLRSSRLTLLYGPSGVGKSSLLQAGVVAGLRRESARAGTESPFAVCVFRAWLEDPVRALEAAALEALEELADEEPLAPAGPTLADSLRAWTEQAGTLLLVLDQFEEYFQYHPDEGGDHGLGGFAAELARIVNDRGLAVNVLLSIREDAWARLDRFEGYIPSLFVNYLRVDHLDPVAAREAIEGPIGAWNRTLLRGEQPYYVEPALADAVIAAAAGGGLTIAAGGEADGSGPEPGDRVEAPFLQLVLERLWRATLAEDSRVLSLPTLESLGGARRIVERHLLDALGRLTPAEQDTASDCFRFLVSRSRTKFAHPASDLAEWTRRRQAQVTAVLDELCTARSGRILRAVAPAADEGQGTSYELFHDVLAEPVLAWRRTHEAERHRREARRRLLRVGGAALALVAALAALSGWAVVERGHARRLFHDTQRSNVLLAKRIEVFTAKRKKDVRDAAVRRKALRTLRSSNGSLVAETAELLGTRNALTAKVTRLRRENRVLAVALRRLNSQNTALAKKVNALDAATGQLGFQLATLESQHELLTSNTAALQRENAALVDEQKKLSDENEQLLAKARQLGTPPLPPSEAAAQGLSAAGSGPAAKAAFFVVPGDTAGSDALRRQVEALARQLVALHEERARQVDEVGFLQSENGLLARQRRVLRLETARLTQTLTTVQTRHGVLTERRTAADAEHRRLGGLRDRAQAEKRKAERQVAARRKAAASLQDKANSQTATMADTQHEISGLRTENTNLVDFIEPPVNNLLREARVSSQNARLAALLAVQAYRLAPYDPDDPNHPAVYNTLWHALDRLDAKAAERLIAPAKTASGKVGTTESATLAKALCSHVGRNLTYKEWIEYLPPAARYSPSRPCGGG